MFLSDISTVLRNKRKRRQAASSGNDYVPILNMAVEFGSGVASREVLISIGNDNTPEQDEEILVILSLVPGDENNEIDDAQQYASIVIHDDDRDEGIVVVFSDSNNNELRFTMILLNTLDGFESNSNFKE